MKRLVLGESEAHGGYAVGPVYLDDAVDELRDLIEDRGDICRGVVVLESAGKFKAETRRRLARGAPAAAVTGEWDEEISAEQGAYMDLLAQEHADEDAEGGEPGV